MTPPFEFLSFNHLPTCKAWIDKPFESVYALNYAHGGRIRWSVNREPVREYCAPLAWWTQPGAYYTYGWPEEPGWDHRYVTFRGPWVEKMLELGWFPQEPATSLCAITSPETFCRKMDALLTALDERSDDQSWIYLLELFQMVREEQSQSGEVRPHIDRLRTLQATIREQPGKTWSVVDAAKICGLSQPHFRRLFRAEAGMPFWQFCVQERMALAATLLRRGELPIKEIAEACGMADVYHFSHVFRQTYGVPPGRFRAENRLTP